MATALPAQQDKLLKEFNEIDAQERNNVLPERSNINLFLIVLIWVIGIFLAGMAIIRGEREFVNQALIGCIASSVALIGAYYNFSWGFFLSSVVALALNGFIAYTTPNYHSEFTIFIDAITIFIIANQYDKKGYVLASTLVISKQVALFVMFRGDRDIEELVGSLVNSVALGFFPVMLSSVARASRRAKKQEIRSEILSLQNQDLVSSWQDFYQAGPSTYYSPSPVPVTPTQPPTSQPTAPTPQA